MAARKAAAPPTATKREQLQKLIDDLNADQENAIKEAFDHFTGPAIQAHLAMMARLQESALPDQLFDQLLKNNITVITATADWLTQWVNRPQPEVQEPQPQP